MSFSHNSNLSVGIWLVFLVGMAIICLPERRDLTDVCGRQIRQP